MLQREHVFDFHCSFLKKKKMRENRKKKRTIHATLMSQFIIDLQISRKLCASKTYSYCTTARNFSLMQIELFWPRKNARQFHIRYSYTVGMKIKIAVGFIQSFAGTKGEVPVLRHLRARMQPLFKCANQ